MSAKALASRLAPQRTDDGRREKWTSVADDQLDDLNVEYADVWQAAGVKFRLLPFCKRQSRKTLVVMRV